MSKGLHFWESRFQSSAYRLSLFLILGFCVPLYFVLTTGYEGVSPTNAVLLAAFMIYSAFFLVINLSSNNVKLLDFIIWFFSYLWLGVAPFVQTISGKSASTTLGIDPDLVPESVGVVFLGIITYQLGSYSAKTRPRKDTGKAMSLSVSVSRVVALALLSWFTFVFYLNLVGPTNLFLDRESKAIVIASAIETNFLPELLFSLTWTLSIISTVCLLQMNRTVRRINDWLILLIAGLPALAIANPLASGRYIFLTVYGSLALVLIEPVIRKFPQMAKLVLVTSVLAILPLLNAFRKQGASGYISSVEDYLATGDFDAFSQIVNGLEYIRDTGAIFSNQFLGPLLFFIPRSIWPEKPLDTGRLLGLHKGYAFTNLSAPLWVEILVSFSILGVAIIFYMLGKYFYQFDLRFQSGIHSIEPLYFPASIFLVIILRGSLLQASAALVFLLISTFIVKRRMTNNSTKRSILRLSRSYFPKVG